jgi:hypothetical protein
MSDDPKRKAFYQQLYAERVRYVLPFGWKRENTRWASSPSPPPETQTAGPTGAAEAGGSGRPGATTGRV